MIEILVTDRLGVVEIQFEHVITIYSLSMIFIKYLFIALMAILRFL